MPNGPREMGFPIEVHEAVWKRKTARVAQGGERRWGSQ